uniref:Uncharacterized protein n=1 Tax=Picea sitchensis TaxID=3332 RepID=A0A6B9XS38_PICSI|nr:hypothetical protein Q903MT_gene5544 [Picea sitchensis]
MRNGSANIHITHPLLRSHTKMNPHAQTRGHTLYEIMEEPEQYTSTKTTQSQQR